jgi:phosphatidylglycerol---prolipoprotein diacylglyceryl transferase
MLSTLLLAYPNIDPVLVAIGPLAIRWYALAYIIGILLGYELIKRINRHLVPPLLTRKQTEDMMVWAIAGIMLGGRLGYVLFYKPDYYFSHPQHILAMWEGGMSFHGGMLGVIVAFWLFARRRQIPYLRLMDMIACAAPIGLFFGRLANFVNGELYGRVTDVSWAMIFPGGGGQPRHPSQLYEAALEGLLLFALLNLMGAKTGVRRYPGLQAGLFLAGYGACRMFIEQFREPDAYLGFVIGEATMGQLLCVPMVLVGSLLILRAFLRRPAESMTSVNE